MTLSTVWARPVALIDEPLRFRFALCSASGISLGTLCLAGPIRLQIGSEMFAGMLAPDEVAQNAPARRGHPADPERRKPSYYGRGR